MIRTNVSLRRCTWRWPAPAACCLLAAYWFFSGAEPARAQTIVRLPNSTASIFAANIFAQADYLRAQGSFMVSAAVARKIHAEAAEHEMRNAVLWVNTYFERRRLNREYRAAENPGFLEKHEKRHDQYHRVLKHSSDLSLDGDVTDELNWMLRDLLANTSFAIFLTDSADSLLSSPDNLQLTAAQKHHLRLSEGKNVGGKTLAFRADTAEVLETKWPMALRDERFDALRAEFEQARDAAMTDLRTKDGLSRANESRLMKAVDNLTIELNEAYPHKRQTQSPQTFLTYLTSKRYLQTLALSTFRLIETQNVSAFDESYRFRGSSVAELMQHMMTTGLQFAPPEPGDEPTYRVVFSSMRALYLALVPDPAQSRQQ